MPIHPYVLLDILRWVDETRVGKIVAVGTLVAGVALGVMLSIWSS